MLFKSYFLPLSFAPSDRRVVVYFSKTNTYLIILHIPTLQLENGQTKDNKCAKESTSDEFPLNEDEIEQVILEKLRLIDEKPKFHQEKVKELYDDIQIFAYFEKGDRKEKSRNAILSLRTHIGEHDSEELFKIIDKIAKNEMKPNLKAFKIPRSWRKAKK